MKMSLSDQRILHDLCSRCGTADVFEALSLYCRERAEDWENNEAEPIEVRRVVARAYRKIADMLMRVKS